MWAWRRLCPFHRTELSESGWETLFLWGKKWRCLFCGRKESESPSRDVKTGKQSSSYHQNPASHFQGAQINTQVPSRLSTAANVERVSRISLSGVCSFETLKTWVHTFPVLATYLQPMGIQPILFHKVIRKLTVYEIIKVSKLAWITT